jgi:hypothetical protein
MVDNEYFHTIESILKLYFHIRVVRWINSDTFNGILYGKNDTFRIVYGVDNSAFINFSYLGEPFHIEIIK